MPTLKDLIESHIATRRISPRAFAEQTGMSYPTLLSLVTKGHVPRKVEHREALRTALGIDPEAWALVLGASGKDGIDLDSGEPPTLQQLVVKQLYRHGFSEQTFATSSGIPYPTLLGVTRKGAIPRNDTLVRLAELLGLPVADVQAAAERSKGQRRDPQSPPAPAATPAPASMPSPGTPSLAQLVAQAAHRRGASLATFARAHELPYLSLMRLVATGMPPAEDHHPALAAALGLAPEAFAASLAKSSSRPEPAQMDAETADQGSQLQIALRAVMDRKGLTMKAFAELSDLSVLTATRLVKHGALPSRSTTHQKLRSLLDLTESDYENLLRRSQPSAERTSTAALAAGVVPSAGDDEFQHRETEEITPHGEVREALAPRQATAAHAAPPADDELADLIGRLNVRQKQALHAFLLSVL